MLDRDTCFTEIRSPEYTYQMIEYLVAYYPYHLERLTRRHRVDDDISMYSNEMLRVQDAVLVLSYSSAYWTRSHHEMAHLARCIHDLGGIVLSFVFDDSAESVFDRRIVALDEVMFNEPNGQRRFPCRNDTD